MAVYRSTKRDTHAMWNTHMPPPLCLAFDRLQDGEPIELLVNGCRTRWARMNSGAGRRTRGLRLITGHAIWVPIPLGAEFTVAVADGDSAPFKSRRITRVTGSGRRSREPLFDAYLFADYSGAADVMGQRRSIKAATATRGSTPSLRKGSLTRATLDVVTLDFLHEQTVAGRRAAIGRDHQYGLPAGLVQEIGLAGRPWRELLSSLISGAYGGPKLGQAATFAREFNAWMQRSGRAPYFYSATKSDSYGIPREDPRPSTYLNTDSTTFRLTELCMGVSNRLVKPKPFNRVGDKGTVGGQTLVGIMHLVELLNAAQQQGIAIAVWPFDGLDIMGPAYQGRHCMLEIDPTSLRPENVPQTDANDALETVRAIQQSDAAADLPRLLGLEFLDGDQAMRVQQCEGWIAGHRQ